jgi:hypothetical protein
VRLPILSRLFDDIRDLVRVARRDRENRLWRKEYEREKVARIVRGEIPPDFASYSEYMGSAWWQTLRQRTLAHLSHSCEFCGGIATQVHHSRYPKDKRGWGHESIKSLYAVCSRCHDVAHGKEFQVKPEICAFCSSRAATTLSIRFRRYTKKSQPVCRRCEALGKGYRAQANHWSAVYYEEWVTR